MIYTYAVYITYFKEVWKEFRYEGQILGANKLAYEDLKDLAESTAVTEFNSMYNSEYTIECVRFVLLNAQKIDEIFA